MIKIKETISQSILTPLHKPVVFTGIETNDAKKIYFDVSKDACFSIFYQFKNGDKEYVPPKYWLPFPTGDTDNMTAVAFLKPETYNEKPSKIIYGHKPSLLPTPGPKPTINAHITNTQYTNAPILVNLSINSINGISSFIDHEGKIEQVGDETNIVPTLLKDVTINANGLYLFGVYDVFGQYAQTMLKIDNIDKQLPNIIQIDKKVIDAFSVQVLIGAIDLGSGVHKISIDGVETINQTESKGYSASAIITSNKRVEIIVTDRAGNETKTFVIASEILSLESLKWLTNKNTNSGKLFTEQGQKYILDYAVTPSNYPKDELLLEVNIPSIAYVSNNSKGEITGASVEGIAKATVKDINSNKKTNPLLLYNFNVKNNINKGQDIFAILNESTVTKITTDTISSRSKNINKDCFVNITNIKEIVVPICPNITYPKPKISFISYSGTYFPPQGEDFNVSPDKDINGLNVFKDSKGDTVVDKWDIVKELEDIITSSNETDLKIVIMPNTRYKDNIKVDYVYANSAQAKKEFLSSGTVGFNHKRTSKLTANEVVEVQAKFISEKTNEVIHNINIKFVDVATYGKPPIKPTINFNLKSDMTSGTVNISYTDTNQNNCQYKIDNGAWQNYSNPFDVTENCIIYAKETNEVGSSEICDYAINSIIKPITKKPMMKFCFGMSFFSNSDPGYRCVNFSHYRPDENAKQGDIQTYTNAHGVLEGWLYCYNSYDLDYEEIIEMYNPSTSTWVNLTSLVSIKIKGPAPDNKKILAYKINKNGLYKFRINKNGLIGPEVECNIDFIIKFEDLDFTKPMINFDDMFPLEMGNKDCVNHLSQFNPFVSGFNKNIYYNCLLLDKIDVDMKWFDSSYWDYFSIIYDLNLSKKQSEVINENTPNAVYNFNHIVDHFTAMQCGIVFKSKYKNLFVAVDYLHDYGHKFESKSDTFFVDYEKLDNVIAVTSSSSSWSPKAIQVIDKSKPASCIVNMYSKSTIVHSLKLNFNI